MALEPPIPFLISGKTFDNTHFYNGLTQNSSLPSEFKDLAREREDLFGS
jgi:hypothetical protein